MGERSDCKTEAKLSDDRQGRSIKSIEGLQRRNFEFVFAKRVFPFPAPIALSCFEAKLKVWWWCVEIVEILTSDLRYNSLYSL